MIDLVAESKWPLLVATLAVPLLVFLRLGKKWRGVPGFAGLVLVSAVVMSLLILLQGVALDVLLEHAIAPLDRDGDGIWSAAEEATWTATDRRNLAWHFGDGGRNVFAGVLFPAFSLLYSALTVGACLGVARWRGARAKR